MYKQTTNCSSVNEAKREMFVKDDRDLENIPPTAAALFQHVLWACMTLALNSFSITTKCKKLEMEVLEAVLQRCSYEKVF